MHLTQHALLRFQFLSMSLAWIGIGLGPKILSPDQRLTSRSELPMLDPCNLKSLGPQIIYKNWMESRLCRRFSCNVNIPSEDHIIHSHPLILMYSSFGVIYYDHGALVLIHGCSHPGPMYYHDLKPPFNTQYINLTLCQVPLPSSNLTKYGTHHPVPSQPASSLSHWPWTRIGEMQSHWSKAILIRGIMFENPWITCGLGMKPWELAMVSWSSMPIANPTNSLLSICLEVNPTSK